MSRQTAAKFVALLWAFLGASCHPNTAVVTVHVDNIPTGAAKLLLTVRLGDQFADPIDPFALPKSTTDTTVTLGLRLPIRAAAESLVVGAGAVNDQNCPQSIGFQRVDYRGIEAKDLELHLGLTPTPTAPRPPCTLQQPLIFGVTPSSGPSDGSGFILIDGWGIDKNASVAIGAQAISAPQWYSSSLIAGTPPAALGVYGHVPVRIANLNGASTQSSTLFSYYASELRLAPHTCISAAGGTSSKYLFAIGPISGTSAGPELVRVDQQTGKLEIYTDVMHVPAAQLLASLSPGVVPSAIALSPSIAGGRSDLIYTTNGDGGVLRFPNLAASPYFAFTPDKVVRTFVGLSASAVASGQRSGSAGPDLILADQAFDEVNILLSQPDGTTSRKNRLTYGVMPQPVTVLAADLTGDKKPDVVIGHRNLGIIETIAQVSDKNPPGWQAMPVPVATSSTYHDLSAADLDGDGAADLIFAEDIQGKSTIHILFMTANSGESVIVRESKTIPAMSLITSLLAYDLSGDGRAEIIAATAGPGLLVYELSDKGDFQAAPGVGDAPGNMTALFGLYHDADHLPDLLSADAVTGVVTCWKNTSL